jgi:hypothetical protein
MVTHRSVDGGPKGLRVYAIGSWGVGGRVVLTVDRRPVSLDLPAALFDTLAVLIREVEQPPRSEAWAPHGFIPVDRFRTELRRLTASTPNPLVPDRLLLARYILRLRRTLVNALTPVVARRLGKRASAGTPDWVKKLIENRRVLGYRLAVARQNVRLILTDPHGGPRQDAARWG